MRSFLRAACMLAAVLALSSAQARADEAAKPEAPKDILFHCSFNGTVTPEIQAGEKGATVSPNTEFVKGTMGRALLTGHGHSAVFPARGNISVTEGTLTFWVMPMDWKVGDNLFHHFFRLDSTPPEGMKDARLFSLLLYKFGEWDDLLAYGMNNEFIGSNILRLPMANNWIPKQAHQIAFTWDSKGGALYLDGEGKEQKYLREAPNLLNAENFVVGGPYFAVNDTRTAINELYIYNRKMPADEISRMYKKQLIEGVMKR